MNSLSHLPSSLQSLFIDKISTGTKNLIAGLMATVQTLAPSATTTGVVGAVGTMITLESCQSTAQKEDFKPADNSWDDRIEKGDTIVLSHNPNFMLKFPNGGSVDLNGIISLKPRVTSVADQLYEITPLINSSLLKERIASYLTQSGGGSVNIGASIIRMDPKDLAGNTYKEEPWLGGVDIIAEEQKGVGAIGLSSIPDNKMMTMVELRDLLKISSLPYMNPIISLKKGDKISFGFSGYVPQIGNYYNFGRLNIDPLTYGL